MSELSSLSRDLIERAHGGHDPSPAQRERLRASLAIGIAAGAAVATATTASAASVATSATSATTGVATGASLTAKILVATALATGAVTGGAAAVRHTTADAPLVRIDRPAAPARAHRRIVEEAPAPMVGVPRPAPAAPVVEALPAQASPRRPARAEAPSSAPDVEPVESPSLATDASLLQVALRADRRADWDGVLAATARHADEFPGSSFAADRDALRAVALCRTGDLEGGRALVGTLAGRAGGALDRARRACARGDEDDPPQE